MILIKCSMLTWSITINNLLVLNSQILRYFPDFNYSTSLPSIIFPDDLWCNHPLLIHKSSPHIFLNELRNDS